MTGRTELGRSGRRGGREGATASGLEVVAGSRRRGRAGPAGFALPVALLLLLALGALAHGALLLARAEASASRLAVSLLARELAVRGALRTALLADTLPSLAPGGVSELPYAGGTASAVRIHVTRLSAELHLLRAEAAGSSASAAGLVVWSLDPAARAATLVAGVPPAGPLEPSPPPDPECLEVGLTERAEAALLAEAPPPGLGLIPGDSVRAGAVVRVSGTVTPRPGDDPWACLTDASLNWGAPGDPHHPCAGHRPLVAADGDLVVEGGEGQGVLAVEGDVTLRGTLYHGLVLAGGRVELVGGARVRGAVRAGAGVATESHETVLADPCAVYLALRAAPALRAPRPLPTGAWLRPL